MKKIIILFIYSFFWSCATIQVQSTPPKAKIIAKSESNLTGVEIGETPLEKSLSEVLEKVPGQSVILEIKMDGYKSKEILIPNFSLGNIVISASLEKEQEIKNIEKERLTFILNNLKKDFEIYQVDEEKNKKAMSNPLLINMSDQMKYSYAIDFSEQTLQLTLERKADSIELAINAEKNQTISKNEIKTRNTQARKILEIYQALTGEQFDQVIQQSNELIKEAPYIAAPFILKALALIGKNNKSEAANELRKAIVIDPEDPNLQIMLQNLEE